jgi:hypothetical protein
MPAPAGELMVNPMCWFSWHGPLPPDKAARTMLAEHLYPSDSIIWVDDPGTRAVWPYWVGAEYAEHLQGLYPGCSLPHELPPHVAWVLMRAAILVEVGFPERRRKAWLDLARDRAASFARGYAAVEGLIPPLQLGALRRYYRYHTRAGTFTLGDDQVALRRVAHNEGVTAFFHCQLTHAVSDIAGTLVRPSYSYIAAYESGAVLERHTDREQCEYSITLCIDAAPEPERQVPWPIQLDVADGALRIWQHIGEGLVYRGRHLPHYRDPLAEGHTCTSLLFHYVDYEFAGSLS